MISKKMNKPALLKILIFVGFIIFAIILVRFTSIREFLNVEQLGHFLKKVGIWAPIVFMVIYAIGVCLFVPGTVLGAMGAVFFGTWWGFLYVWMGAMAGASIAFFIGRYLGRDFTASLIGETLKRYDKALERNGFATVLYLRLAYFPFTPMNFGMGLTRVQFRDYFFGTGLGIMVGTFIYIFFISTFKDVWVSRSWGSLLSLNTLFSVSLFIFSLFIPRIINIIKNRKNMDI